MDFEGRLEDNIANFQLLENPASGLPILTTGPALPGMDIKTESVTIENGTLALGPQPGLFEGMIALAWDTNSPNPQSSVQLTTRVGNIQAELKAIEKDIVQRKTDAENARALVLKYTTQQNNVKNNREYDSLSKEIEYQGLEADLAEKRIREFTLVLKDCKEQLDKAQLALADRKIDLENKKTELANIIKETAKEEEEIVKRSEQIQSQIDDRMLAAYKKVRSNARNGLAVVTIRRDACGGCFNKIPPQRQLDIRMSKKIIVCEYCGRILVDGEYEK